MRSFIIFATSFLLGYLSLGLIATAGELTIACWNVENLFDDVHDKRTPAEDLFSAELLQVKLKKDAEIIKLLKADILGLVEVENKAVLRRLVKEHLKGEGYRYFELIESESARGIDCAIVSRYPFLCRSISVPDFERELLLCRFVIQQQPLYVLVCHWKSRRGGGEELRLQCSKTVLDVVQHRIKEYEGKAAPVVVMGDLNDTDTDPSVKLLEPVLFNTLKSKPEAERWTLVFDDRDAKKVLYQGFDHLFITSDLQNADKLKWIRSEVVKPKEMITQRMVRSESFVWPKRDTNGQMGYSDHLPVRAIFRVKD